MVACFMALLSLIQPGGPAGQDSPKQDSKLQDKVEDQEDRIKDLEKKIQDLEKRQAQTTSANPLTVLNPTLTVVGDFLWRVDDKEVYVDSDPANDRIDDTLNFREMEFDLRAAVDPYVDAVAILAVESEAPGDYGVDVEEFYAVLKSLPLPFWERPPLGTRIKLGRFRTEWGLNNKSHLHDLPQSDRPLAIGEFLSPEGHVSNGVSVTSFLPSPGDTALQVTGQVLQGGGIGVAQDRTHIAYLGNVNFFVPLADEHSVNLGLIGFYAINDPDGRDQSRVAGLDLLYKWKPLRQGEYSSFVAGGQLFYADHEFQDPASGLNRRTTPFGYSAWGQFQLSARLYAGLRWDQTDFLADDSLQEKRITPYFTWYTSEFFRARFSYERTWSDDPVTDNLDTFLFEVVVVFGAHPPEPFWVNK
jgi:hypothetical protein